VALELARRFPAEIVSVDSAQVYRGMDVGTAKPSREERARTPHHLIDIVEPTDSYSAGRFRDDALRLVEEIHARGRVPILAGGTMLLFPGAHGRARGPAAAPTRSCAARSRSARRGGMARVARRARARVDPGQAARIDATDPQRIQRALEVWELTGTPLSELQVREAAPQLPFEALKLALEPSDRAVLHDASRGRFHAMLEAGLLDEVASCESAMRSREACRRCAPWVTARRGRRSRGVRARRRFRRAASPPRDSWPSASSRGCDRCRTWSATTACGPDLVESRAPRRSVKPSSVFPVYLKLTLSLAR
jgi:tRNA dimethylallyltransferase